MTPSPTVADVAAEAEFQLLVAKDYQVWLCALARAIHLSHMHDGGCQAEHLASLVKYFDDTNFGNIESSIEQFQKIEKDHSAPQKTTSRNRGAGGAAC
ncbi:hypothetical protein [Pseudomonas sp. NMI795_08]|uniref:hypothetical protein n=1 Tax=Pseudomonas sp. NMI795_08 TaxID=2903144 RepID=UPI001E4D047A|nr:hypothetical protein [Pseudomonas sp. NMI795_08]MCE1117450.1 hypothetical protein [Pseudomonas sp. NMI795_08]